MGTLRTFYPQIFHDYKNIDQHALSDLGVSAIIATELVLAENAFRVAMGEKGMDPLERRAVIATLNSDYNTYGISTGVRQTAELVRQMEKAAAKQSMQRGV
jgi:hypothetical protein